MRGVRRGGKWRGGVDSSNTPEVNPIFLCSRSMRPADWRWRLNCGINSATMRQAVLGMPTLTAKVGGVIDVITGRRHLGLLVSPHQAVVADAAVNVVRGERGRKECLPNPSLAFVSPASRMPPRGVKPNGAKARRAGHTPRARTAGSESKPELWSV